MRTRTRNLKRLLSLALCLCMVTGLLPVTALAADAPAITTETLEGATVGELYNATLKAEASDPNGELTWEAAGLPNGLALSGSGETAALIGTPTEAGNFSVTVTVTETIPAVEPEKPAEEPAAGEPAEGTKPDQGTSPAEGTEPDQGTDPAEGTDPDQGTGPAEGTDPDQGTGPAEGTDPDQGTGPAEGTEPDQGTGPAEGAEPNRGTEPGTEPGTDSLLTTTDGGARSTTGTVSATIYLDNGDGQWMDDEKQSTFAVDQAGLILHLMDFQETVPSGWSVESLSFYPTDGSEPYGPVFWSKGGTNGTSKDKLYVDGRYNGVFQLLNFTPNGSSGTQDLSAGTYQVQVYVSNGTYGENYQEKVYLSKETFTITGETVPRPTITTESLPVGYTGEAYNAQMAAKPGTDGNTLTWSATGLPSDLSISEDGLITGMPTQTGNTYVSITVTEKDGSGAAVGRANQSYWISISEKANITGASLNFSEKSPADMGADWTLTLTSGSKEDITLPAGTRLIVSSTAEGNKKMPTVYTARLNNGSSVSATMADGSWSLDLGGKTLNPGENTITLPNVNVGSAALSYSIQMFDSSGVAVGGAKTGTTRAPIKFQYSLNLSETTASVQAEGRLNSPITLTLTAKDEQGQTLTSLNGTVTVKAVLAGGSESKAIKVSGRSTYQAVDGDKPLTSATFPVSLVKGTGKLNLNTFLPVGSYVPTAETKDTLTFSVGDGDASAKLTLDWTALEIYTYTIQDADGNAISDNDAIVTFGGDVVHLDGDGSFRSANAGGKLVVRFKDERDTRFLSAYASASASADNRTFKVPNTITKEVDFSFLINGTEHTLTDKQFTGVDLRLCSVNYRLNIVSYDLSSRQVTLRLDGIPSDVESVDFYANRPASTEVAAAVSDGYSKKARLTLTSSTGNPQLQFEWLDRSVIRAEVDSDPDASSVALVFVFQKGNDDSYDKVACYYIPAGETWNIVLPNPEDPLNPPPCKVVVLRSFAVRGSYDGLKSIRSFAELEEKVDASLYQVLEPEITVKPGQSQTVRLTIPERTANEFLSDHVSLGLTGPVPAAADDSAQVEVGFSVKFEPLRQMVVKDPNTTSGSQYALGLRFKVTDNLSFAEQPVYYQGKQVGTLALVAGSSDEYEVYVTGTFDIGREHTLTFAGSKTGTEDAAIRSARLGYHESWAAFSTSKELGSLPVSSDEMSFLAGVDNNNQIRLWGNAAPEATITFRATTPGAADGNGTEAPPETLTIQGASVTANKAGQYTLTLDPSSIKRTDGTAIQSGDTLTFTAECGRAEKSVTFTYETGEGIVAGLLMYHTPIDRVGEDKYVLISEAEGELSNYFILWPSMPFRFEAKLKSGIDPDRVGLLMVRMSGVFDHRLVRESDVSNYDKDFLDVVLTYDETKDIWSGNTHESCQLLGLPSGLLLNSPTAFSVQYTLLPENPVQKELEYAIGGDGQTVYYREAGSDSWIKATDNNGNGVTIGQPLTAEETKSLGTVTGSVTDARVWHKDNKNLQAKVNAVTFAGGTSGIKAMEERTLMLFDPKNDEGEYIDSKKVPELLAAGFTETPVLDDYGSTVVGHTYTRNKYIIDALNDTTLEPVELTEAQLVDLVAGALTSNGDYDKEKAELMLQIYEILTSEYGSSIDRVTDQYYVPEGEVQHLATQTEQGGLSARAVAFSGPTAKDGGLDVSRPVDMSSWNEAADAADAQFLADLTYNYGRYYADHTFEFSSEGLTIINDVSGQAEVYTWHDAAIKFGQEFVNQSLNYIQTHAITYLESQGYQNAGRYVSVAQSLGDAAIEWTTWNDLVLQIEMLGQDIVTLIHPIKYFDVDGQGQSYPVYDFEKYSDQYLAMSPKQREAAMDLYEEYKRQFPVEMHVDHAIMSAADMVCDYFGGELGPINNVMRLCNVPTAQEVLQIQYEMYVSRLQFMADKYLAVYEQIMKKPIKVKIDPSGFVYEGVTDKRLEGVTAEIWKADDSSGTNAAIWSEHDAAEYGEVNTITTGPNGYYAWNVPEGWWQVRLSKDGYTSVRSGWLPVLPVQTDVNLNMVSAIPPEVASTEAVDGQLIITFTQAIKVSEASKITLLAGGRDVAATVTPVHEENGLSLAFVVEPASGGYSAGTGYVVQAEAGITAYNNETLAVTYTSETIVVVQPGTDPVNPNPGGGGGGGGSSGYSISVPSSSSIKGGSITVSPRSADKGDTVTITVKPDDGYELNTLTVTDAKGNELEVTDKGSGKYTFSMPGSSVKVQVSFREITEPASNPFTDVYESDYYYDAVLWAVANGVTAGTSATTFSPNAPVTRAQMVTFLWRAYGSPKATGSNPFADVSADAWYYDAVLWAVANGVTVGTSATTFSPDAPVTRSQAVTFQWRAAGSPVVAGDSFDDVAADAYYAGAVAWAVAGGITNGTGGNKFSPEVTVTRAQAVTFLWRELA